MVQKIFYIVSTICLIFLLISHIYAVNLDTSNVYRYPVTIEGNTVTTNPITLQGNTINTNLGTVKGNTVTANPGIIGEVTKPNLIITDIQGNAYSSDNPAYDLMVPFSYYIKNQGVTKVGPLTTSIFTTDNLDNEKVIFSLSGHPSTSPLTFYIYPDENFVVGGIIYIKKPTGSSICGDIELKVFIDSDSTKLAEKMVKIPFINCGQINTNGKIREVGK